MGAITIRFAKVKAFVVKGLNSTPVLLSVSVVMGVYRVWMFGDGFGRRFRV
jgi:hypothetical protein